MAQDITLLGASYEDVPAVELPKTGGGTASFTDVTDSDVTTDDVMDGVTFYAPNGTKGTGTLSNATLGQGYGTCSTAVAETTKIVTLSGYKLVKGGIIAVKFSYGVPSGSSLKVNNEDAAPIYYGDSAIHAGNILPDDIAFFMYDGYRYRLIGIDRIQRTISGVQIGESIAAGSYKDYSVLFGHTYDSPPDVIATLYSTSTAGTVGRINVSVNEITTLGFIARVFNGDSSARSPGFRWYAIGR